MKTLTALLMMTVFISPTVYALEGGTAMIASDGAQTQVEFLEPDKLRVAEPNTGGYMLMTDGKLYTVITEGGQTMVFDVVAAMASMGDAMQQEGFWDEEIQSVQSVEATGETEWVAGIEGEVYEMTFTNGQGQTETSTLVLSDNAQVAALTRVMHRMTEILIGAGGSQMPQSVRDMEKHVLGKNLGVLRQGSDFQLAMINDDAPDASRFVLPAEPMDMSGMYGANGEANPLSDYMAEKAARQKQRQENKAERAVDRATDKAVDKVVDKVLGKLFN